MAVDHFLLSALIDRRSKLRSAAWLSRRLALPGAFRATGEDEPLSAPLPPDWWSLCTVDDDGRLLLPPLPENNRPVQSPEEVGRLDGVAAIFDELPVRDKMCVFSVSAARASLDELKESAMLLCLEWSPWRPELEFLLANASTAPVNLSRISCPEGLSVLSTDGPIPANLPLGCRTSLLLELI